MKTLAKFSLQRNQEIQLNLCADRGIPAWDLPGVGIVPVSCLAASQSRQIMAGMIEPYGKAITLADYSLNFD